MRSFSRISAFVEYPPVLVFFSAGSPSFSKFALTGAEKKESMVLMCALPSLRSSFWRCSLSGCSAIASESASAIFFLSSAAALLVKVTMSIRPMVLFSSAIIESMILRVSVKVLPEPVTPWSVAAGTPSRRCSTNLSIASGWSPIGA